MDKHGNGRKPHPQNSANFISRLFMWWTRELFKKSSDDDLKMEDLYDPLKCEQSQELESRLEREWIRELESSHYRKYPSSSHKHNVNRRPNLKRAIFRALFWENVLMASLELFTMIVVRLTQPILQGWIMKYYEIGDPTTKTSVFCYAMLFSLMTLILILCIQHGFNYGAHIGIRARIACSSLIFSKVLVVHKSAAGKAAAGQVINLLTSDVSRFDSFFSHVHYIWIAPIQVGLVMYLMWRSTGISAIIGTLSCMLLTFPFQSISVHFSNKWRTKTALLSDKRIQFIHEFLAGIQIIKIQAWEKPFEKLSSMLRLAELKPIKTMLCIHLVNNTFMDIGSRISLFITLVIFVSLGHSLSATISYPTMTYFVILQLTLNYYLPEGFISYGQTCASLKRIEEFLLLDERDPTDLKMITNNFYSCNEKIKDELILKPSLDYTFGEEDLQRKPLRVELYNVSAKWNEEQASSTLSNISLKVEAGTVCALIGSVGSGKTAVLNLILKELHLENGTVIFDQSNVKNNHILYRSGYYANNINLQISYCSQEPWLFSGTVKENILFGQSYNHDRYVEVIEVCSLVQDLQQLPNGDLTIVGERGAAISGGQRARINLARAVYREADLYLLDDPLSAVDVHVGHHIFKQCIMEFLEGKTRIIVTHHLQFLPKVNSIAIVDKGAINHQGSFKKLKKTCYRLIGNLNKKSVNPSREETLDENRVKSHEILPKKVLTDAWREIDLNSEGHIEQSIDEEEIESGKLKTDVYVGYIKASGHIGTYILFAVLIIGSIFGAVCTDYWISFWTNLENAKNELNRSKIIHANRRENISERTPDIKVIVNDDFFSTSNSIYIYAFCLLVCIIFSALRNYTLMRICLTASRNLYSRMFSNILYSTLDFIHSNPSGRILNRFSKDIGSVDEILPKCMMEIIQIIVALLTVSFLIAVVNVYFIIFLLILAIITYFGTSRYVPTIHHLKRLESVAKSPVLTIVNETIVGLTTIRSSGKAVENKLRKEFHKSQDNHTKVSHLIVATTTAIGIFLDIMCFLFVSCVIFGMLLFFDKRDSQSGYVGLAISESLLFLTELSYGIKQGIQFFTLMTSVERILQYTKVPQEQTQGLTSDELPKPWPSQGCVKFKNVSMSYKNNGHLALKNLNVTIEAGWRVGIVGRTGAGKSSLISAVLRLTDHLKGNILIDDVDISEVSLHDLRSSVSVIPQEPILFSENLRYNLDPSGLHSAAAILEALRIVELENLSLDEEITERGNNISIGERQLICIARAILRNNRVLILDEATSNIDSHTELLIQKTIRSAFTACTVLTIAHRLSTVMDSDRIIVLDAGRIAEFGHPFELLSNHPEGFLSNMVNQSEETVSKRLIATAKSSYMSNHNHPNNKSCDNLI